MAGETVITVVGNLTDDPELRFLPNGTAMVKFTVASTPRVFDRDKNEYRDGDPLFLVCTGWRDMAEHIAESLTKGTRVIVSGRLRQFDWKTDAGENRSMLAIEVDEIGPSLRFATAKVTKAQRGEGGGGFGGGGGGGGFGGFGGGGGSSDPWSTPPASSDEPPF